MAYSFVVAPIFTEGKLFALAASLAKLSWEWYWALSVPGRVLVGMFTIIKLYLSALGIWFLFV